MKQFACGDVVPGCDATFEAADEDGLFGQIAEHARAAHGIHEVTPDLVAAVRARIVTTD